MNSEAAAIAGLDFTLEVANLSELDRVELGGQSLNVVSSSETQLEVALPLEARSGMLQVNDLEIPLEVYDYQSIPMPDTPGTAAKPLSIDIDAQGDVWLNQEFHRALHRINAGQDPMSVDAFEIPLPSDGPFATTIFGDRQTGTSVLGEDIEVDANQNVWFTEGGGSLYTGAFENHSRVVRFVPSAERFDVFNVPGDRNEVIGLLVDGEDVWFAQGNPAEAALYRFKPDTMMPDDGTFDFSASLDDMICEGSAREGCYEKFVMPTVNAHPAHLAVDADGWIWVTEYFRTAISALNPSTGEFKRYPQAPSEERAHVLLGSGPWEIFIDDAGDVVFNSYFNNTVSWFDHARRDDPACLTLDQDEQNPCVLQLRVEQEIELAQVHSVTKGDNGRVWFTTAASADELVPTSVGFVNADKEIIRLPQLSLVSGSGGGQNGIVRDPNNSVIWFAEFFGNAVGRLSKKE